MLDQLGRVRVMLEHVRNLGTVVDARNTAARVEDQARENAECRRA
jgi:hypothetical protein